MQLVKRYPSIRLVLQDLPEEIEAAERKVWPERCPEAIAERRIDFVPLDFFKGSPKKGCDIYFVSLTLLWLRMISNADCD
jgi:hypothetical protein